jgi:hypothetical protein
MRQSRGADPVLMCVFVFTPAEYKRSEAGEAV